MAKAEWRRIAPKLARLGLLTLIDRASLAAYCQLWSRWQKAEAVLQRDGLTFMTPNGFLQKRPEVTIARESMALLRNFSTEFGLSPASRSRVQAVSPAEEIDPFEEFLGRANPQASH
jgi:P27 family predicted phage terminase small subunit